MGNDSPLILCDIDGTVADWDSAFLHLLNGLTKQHKKLGPEGPTVWDWPTEELGFTPAQVSQAWEVIKKEGGYFWEYDVKPLPGTEEALSRLSMLNQTGHAEVYFVTTRPGPRAQVRTAKWLMRWGYMGPPAVIVTKHKGMIANGLNAAFRRTIAIDDRPENIAQFQVAGADAYLIDRAHNRNFNPSAYPLAAFDEVPRVPDLKAALDAAGLAGYREEVVQKALAEELR